MDLFRGKEVHYYTSKKYDEMKNEIMSFSNQTIMTADFDEWVVYFESKYYIQPIEVFEDNIDSEISETKLKCLDKWGYDIYGQEYVIIDGYCITFTIPFDGDEELLMLKPSSYVMTTYSVDSVQKPKNDSCGAIKMSFEYTVAELKAKKDMYSFVWDSFRRKFKNYSQMIANVNADVTRYNNSIAENARKLLDDRKQKASDFVAVSATLNIPMTRSKNAPNTMPVVLKRVKIEPASRPKEKPVTPEWTITDEDYRNIINVIHSTCVSMEETAKTFSTMEEELLRDFIITVLGTHYENSASGETFRRNGKTDIMVVFENKAAFIGECKIWHGIKRFEDAVQQLFSYSTWRDVKLALIVFNKDVKDFDSIREKVQQWIKDNTKSYTSMNGNIWNCVIHRQDSNADVSVAIALYDLTI